MSVICRREVARGGGVMDDWPAEGEVNGTVHEFDEVDATPEGPGAADAAPVKDTWSMAEHLKHKGKHKGDSNGQDKKTFWVEEGLSWKSNTEHEEQCQEKGRDRGLERQGARLLVRAVPGEGVIKGDQCERVRDAASLKSDHASSTATGRADHPHSCLSDLRATFETTSALSSTNFVASSDDCCHLFRCRTRNVADTIALDYLKSAANSKENNESLVQLGNHSQVHYKPVIALLLLDRRKLSWVYKRPVRGHRLSALSKFGALGTSMEIPAYLEIAGLQALELSQGTVVVVSPGL
ncbi:hypothetical protein DFH07DRAFT_771897 [Mycena maculata]|uniref:Uncharacterized protein n=1 Tax=Mycena maculata TaxID=230809 RepID=A0AAD7JBG1_9AGAR|nr:hypothetical protein DFH07DRAFT_771897 [Mycena maculata]